MTINIVTGNVFSYFGYKNIRTDQISVEASLCISVRKVLVSTLELAVSLI